MYAKIARTTSRRRKRRGQRWVDEWMRGSRQARAGEKAGGAVEGRRVGRGWPGVQQTIDAAACGEGKGEGEGCDLECRMRASDGGEDGEKELCFKLLGRAAAPAASAVSEFLLL
ncbi:MAG: hypothetical protein M1820_007452 [Bogoriella megaspora]|nr:MAG: hypothetical protein M1820_007452 [Bogoriella megaspora]